MVFINSPMTSLQDASKSAYHLVEHYLRSVSATATAARTGGIDQVKRSLGIIEKAFSEYTLDEIAVSFNGGKDCHVMLVLILATLHKLSLSQGNTIFCSLSQLPTVYVRSEQAFTEVDSFVQDCNDRYALSTTTLPYPMKDAFGRYLDQHKSIQVIFVGIRRTDPYGDTLKYEQETDRGWPRFLRLHPVLEWHYVEIWDFLRYLGIDYCRLYDDGYTSLGGTNNTSKNPALIKGHDKDGTPLYRPAYELTEDREERLGRQ